MSKEELYFCIGYVCGIVYMIFVLWFVGNVM